MMVPGVVSQMKAGGPENVPVTSLVSLVVAMCPARERCPSRRKSQTLNWKGNVEMHLGPLTVLINPDGEVQQSCGIKVLKGSSL